MGQTAIQFWLDHECAAPRTDDLLVIETERQFLEAVGSPGPFLVRGLVLCEWARHLSVARNLAYRDVQSPWSRLCTAAPGLEEGRARQLIDRLAPDVAWQIASETVTASQVMAIFEEDNSLWKVATPTTDSVLRFLAWWVDDQHDRDLEPVVRALGNEWATGYPGLAASRLLNVDSSEQARRAAFDWLVAGRLVGTGLPRMGAAPEAIVGSLGREIEAGIRSGTIDLDAVLGWNVWKAIEMPVALAVANVVIERKMAITESHLAWFESHSLPATELNGVRHMMSLGDPGDPPTALDELWTWYQDRYWRWRQSVEARPGDDPVHHRWRELGEKFGRWYLHAYPTISVDPREYDRLVWVRANHLGASTDMVAIVVILDGALQRDAERLLAQVRASDASLMVVTDDVAMAPLPTVTDFTKRTIVHGVTAVEATTEGSGAGAPTIDRVIEALKSSENGTPIIWRHVQPDYAYHFAPPGQRQIDVDAELGKIAAYIREVVKAIPAPKKLRLIITSDHGRLLGKSTRDIVPPKGTTSHGRAAWGPCPSPIPPAAAHWIDEDAGIAWLDPSTYGLPPGNAYAVSISDHAFRTTDGKGGVDEYSHGGLFPEEVFVPWIVLERNVVVHDLQIEFSGDGTVGDAGMLRLQMKNINSFPVGIDSVRVESVSTAGTLLRFRIGERLEGSRVFQLPIQPWPDFGADGEVRIHVEYQLPGKSSKTETRNGRLESRAMYRKDNSLLDDF